MEDLATGRMSVAQIAQRLIHSARDSETGEMHDYPLVKRILQEERDDIVRIMTEEAGDLDESGQRLLAAATERYHKAFKIALRWVKNYTELDFRSLGSYTHEQLHEIAAAPDAF
jgi:malate synthase